LTGPSPRAWGLAVVCCCRDLQVWSIPTCVGLGARARTAELASAVHPHVRGAWVCTLARQDAPGGPSPRAWGLATAIRDNCPIGRSIPTCVGLGASVEGGVYSSSVHPHVRGAWQKAIISANNPDGPSPRAWGLAPPDRQRRGRRRSIPTCVGLGGAQARKRRPTTVHPHVRGAWTTSSRFSMPRGGPSPRAWGLERPPEAGCIRVRSIPTCVGLGTRARRLARSRSVHPHVRGAWVRRRTVRRRAVGPSPRAWGLDGGRLVERPSSRSIPTCVGLGD